MEGSGVIYAMHHSGVLSFGNGPFIISEVALDFRSLPDHG